MSILAKQIGEYIEAVDKDVFDLEKGLKENLNECLKEQKDSVVCDWKIVKKFKNEAGLIE